MERLKNMKENLTNLVQSQISGNLANVDTKELGEAIDMIKDLSEALYYCSVVEAMEDADKKSKERYEEHHHHYTERMIPYEQWERDYDREDGIMYYPRRGGYPYRYPIYYDGEGNGYSGRQGNPSNNGSRSSNGNNARGENSRGYRGHDWDSYPMKIEDYREGKSPNARKMYMESKELHKGKEVQMKELEKYMHELSSDVTEMIQDASPEEKQMLRAKITELAGKIG